METSANVGSASDKDVFHFTGTIPWLRGTGLVASRTPQILRGTYEDEHAAFGMRTSIDDILNHKCIRGTWAGTPTYLSPERAINISGCYILSRNRMRLDELNEIKAHVRSRQQVVVCLSAAFQGRLELRFTCHCRPQGHRDIRDRGRWACASSSTIRRKPWREPSQSTFLAARHSACEPDRPTSRIRRILPDTGQTKNGASDTDLALRAIINREGGATHLGRVMCSG